MAINSAGYTYTDRQRQQIVILIPFGNRVVTVIHTSAWLQPGVSKTMFACPIRSHQDQAKESWLGLD